MFYTAILMTPEKWVEAEAFIEAEDRAQALAVAKSWDWPVRRTRVHRARKGGRLLTPADIGQ